MPKKIATTLALILLAAFALACGSGGNDDPPSSDLPGNNAADDSGAANSEADLKSTVTFADGIAVTIKDIKRGTSSQYVGNEPMVTFKVSIKNGTDHDLDLALVTVQCAIGADGDQSDTIIDPENDLDITINGAVKTGATKSGKFGCPMPKDETALQIEVSLNDSFDRSPAVFTGDVTK